MYACILLHCCPPIHSDPEMKCHVRIRVIVIITLVSLLVTMLTSQLHIQKHSGFVCLRCAKVNDYTKLKEDKLLQAWTANTRRNKSTVNYKSLQGINDLRESAYQSWNNATLPKAMHRTSITLPVVCVEKNCQEFLSEQERRAVNICEEEVRTIEKYSGQIHGSDCRFLPEMGRYPVALTSAEGSGNTWTRGLLERATGICTGYYFCDKIMRAHGFVGENVKSGKVLVVKTHSVFPSWVGENSTNNNTFRMYEPRYSAAVFILRNPVKSAIAEWNRRASQEILGEQDPAIAHERHTHTVPTYLFSKL